MAIETKTPTAAQLVSRFTKYLQTEGFSGNTIRNYIGDCEQFIACAKNVTPESASKYVQAKTNEWSQVTYNRKICSLRKFFKFLKRRSFVDSLPKFKTVKVTQRPAPQSLTPKEIELLLNAPDDSSEIGRRDLMILSLLYRTGLKTGKLCSLAVRDVHPTCNKTIQDAIAMRPIIVIRKELLPLESERLQTLLEMYIERDWVMLAGNHPHPNNPLFISREGTPLSTRSVHRIVANYARKAGIKKTVTPQMLRITMAKRALLNGATITEVMAQLNVGSDQNFLDTYCGG